MAETLTLQASDNFSWVHTADTEFGTQTIRNSFSSNRVYANGNGTSSGSQINEVFSDIRTLAAGANEPLDLFGVLIGEMGDTVDLTKVKELRIRLADAANPDGSNQASSIAVGGASANGWFPFLMDATDRLKVLKGMTVSIGCPVLAGMPVVAGSADQLKIENNDLVNNATYSIAVFGNS